MAHLGETVAGRDLVADLSGGARLDVD